jgi:dihydropteroate synthase
VNSWQCGRFTLDLNGPCVMGIINVTPDSFSDGGQTSSKDTALKRAEQMIGEGAHVLDLGAESSRPGATPVGLDEELERLMPVLEALRDAPVPVSVDTYKPAVMQAALAAGASIINDIYALRQPGAFNAIRGNQCGVVLMHMQGEPLSMQLAPHYDNVVEEVFEFLSDRVGEARAAGIAPERITVDPGFGFGKRVNDNTELLRGLGKLRELDAAGILIGLSRKSMLGAITGRSPENRVGASVAGALAAFERGARIIRCHDVAATVDALNVWQTVGAQQPLPD